MVPFINVASRAIGSPPGEAAAAGGRRRALAASNDENEEGVLCHGATGAGAVDAGERVDCEELNLDDGVEVEPSAGRKEVGRGWVRPVPEDGEADADLLCSVRGRPTAGEDDEAYCLDLEVLGMTAEGTDGGKVLDEEVVTGLGCAAARAASSLSLSAESLASCSFRSARSRIISCSPTNLSSSKSFGTSAVFSTSLT